MPLPFHPAPGTILMCDYEPGFVKPEMVKRRPVVVISPRFRAREGLCTVVPLSSDRPDPIESYHYAVRLIPKLPDPWGAPYYWVKADMVATMGFHRLNLIRVGKDRAGNRLYYDHPLNDVDLEKIRRCVMFAIGVTQLTTQQKEPNFNSVPALP